MLMRRDNDALFWLDVFPVILVACLIAILIRSGVVFAKEGNNDQNLVNGQIKVKAEVKEKNDDDTIGAGQERFRFQVDENSQGVGQTRPPANLGDEVRENVQVKVQGSVNSIRGFLNELEQLLKKWFGQS